MYAVGPRPDNIEAIGNTVPQPSISIDLLHGVPGTIYLDYLRYLDH